MWINSDEFKIIFPYIKALSCQGNYVSYSHTVLRREMNPILAKWWPDKLVVLSGNAKTDVYQVTITQWARDKVFYVVSESMEDVCTMVRNLQGKGFAVAQTSKIMEEIYTDLG